MVHSLLQQSRKAKLGYFWELFDPMMQIGIWFGFYVLIGANRKIYDMNMFLFLGTGIVSLFFFQKIAVEMPAAMRKFKGFARFPSVTQTDTLIAGALLEAVLMTIVSFIIFGTIVLCGFGFAPANPTGVFAALACLGILGFGFGWFNAMVLVFVPVYGKFLPVVWRILLFTSGAIFPLERLPPHIFQYLQWNPVYQGVDLVRSEWSYTHESTTSSDGYVLLCAVGFLLFGLLLQRPAQRQQTA